MKDFLVIDVETTYGSKSNPFNNSGHLVCIGTYNSGSEGTIYASAELGQLPLLNDSHILCGHNLKFDVHWLTRYGVDLSEYEWWDTQTAEFLLTDQKHSWASLNELADKYLGEQKIDIVKEQYWDKGIDTTDIPMEILSEYCIEDCRLTYEIAKKQLQKIPETKRMLFKLIMQDYKILQEMEYNGLRIDYELCASLAKETQEKIDVILSDLLDGISYRDFNFGSTDQLSALLYGGTIIEKRRVPVGVFKTGKRIGEVRCKIELVEHSFPRQYTPLPGTEAAKEGFWSTDEATLHKLKAGELIDKILMVRKLQKQLSTYYDGLRNMQRDYGWAKDEIHGQFNTCVAVSGRLSSSKPNLQNLSGEAQQMFVSRYA